MHSFRHSVSFGDCDPARIVFYPNMFRWMDAAFHDLLRRFGGHGSICEGLGAIGIGVMDAKANFRSPLRDGDNLDIRVLMGEARRSSLGLIYEGFVGDRLAFEGAETRAMFVKSERGISAGDLGPLLAILSGAENRA